MKVDTIIIGQGLSGSILALSLINEGFNVLVINNSETSNSSKVAAGIVNPITGKRVVKTWLADEIFPTLHDFYKSSEILLGAKFFHKKAIYKPYDSINDQNYCISKSGPEDYGAYMNIEPNNLEYQKYMNAPHGGLEILEGGYLDTNTFLSATATFLKSKNALIEKNIDFDELIFNENKVEISGISANHIIFCEGHHVTKNPYFKWLPFAPAKGEVLTIESPELIIENAISKGIFILPIGDHKFRVGATYAWTFDDINTTEKAKNELIAKLDELITVPYKIIAHSAGVRPATKFRRPLIGQHPDHKQLGIFNGFGSKGVSLIPYFALNYTLFLKNNIELLPEIDIQQYLSLYLKSKNN